MKGNDCLPNTVDTKIKKIKCVFKMFILNINHSLHLESCHSLLLPGSEYQFAQLIILSWDKLSVIFPRRSSLPQYMKQNSLNLQ